MQQDGVRGSQHPYAHTCPSTADVCVAPTTEPTIMYCTHVKRSPTIDESVRLRGQNVAFMRVLCVVQKLKSFALYGGLLACFEGIRLLMVLLFLHDWFLLSSWFCYFCMIVFSYSHGSIISA